MVRDIKQTLPKTVEKAVCLLLNRLSEEDKSLMKSLPESDVAWRLHFTLGMMIRNDFGLWDGNTELLKACGSEMLSADDASSAIIRALWTKLRGMT